jgi:hypothetical protein
MSDRWLDLAVRAQHYLVEDAQRVHAERIDALQTADTRLRTSEHAVGTLNLSWCAQRAEAPADVHRDALFLRYQAHLELELVVSRQQQTQAEQQVDDSLDRLQSLFAKRVALDRYASRRDQQRQTLARRLELKEQTEVWLLGRAKGVQGC